jgi:hypothetical protein
MSGATDRKSCFRIGFARAADLSGATDRKSCFCIGFARAADSNARALASGWMVRADCCELRPVWPG